MLLILVVANSPILTMVLVDGGELVSDKTTGSTESESEIEETAAATDWPEQKFTSEVSVVEKLKPELQMANGTQSSASKTSEVTELSLEQLRKLTCQSQVLKYIPEKMKEMMMTRKPLRLTMFLLTLKQQSTKAVLGNLLTTTLLTHIQPQTLSETNLPTPKLVSANGGRFNSTKSTGLTESKSSTEETAAAIDWPEPRSM